VVIGVDIGESGSCAAHLDCDADGRLRLLHAAWCDAEPEGASLGQQAAALRRLWRQGSMPSRTVCCCLPSRAMAVKAFTYRNLCQAEIGPALRLEAEQLLQVPAAEVLVDWQLEPQDARASGGQAPPLAGLLAAVRRHDAVACLAPFRKAGLYPVVLDVASLALCNLFLALETGGGSHDPVLLVSLGLHAADLAVAVDGRCLCPRSVLSRAAPWAQAADFLVENLVEELRFCSQRWHCQRVERLVFVGAVPHDDAFLGRVQDGVELPVELWNPLRKIQLHGAASRLQERRDALGPRMATALGLALRNVVDGPL
jgi:Tfp pilus assembly PilM family ATPase